MPSPTAPRSATGLRISVGQVVLYLVLTVALLIAIVPFIWVIFGSLKSSGEIFSSPFGFPRTWRWSNYETAWVDGHFGTYFFNSLVIAIPTVFLILACGSLAGYAFARLKFWGSTFFFYLFLASLAISTNSIMIPLFHQIYNFGLIDNWWGVVLPTVASHMPMASFLMRAFFRSLPGRAGGRRAHRRLQQLRRLLAHHAAALARRPVRPRDLRVHGLVERVPGPAARAP